MNATATPAKRATLPPAAPDFSEERADVQKELEKLRNKIRELDCLSQSAFSQIAALAKLALKSLEVPDPHGHNLESLARAFEMIWTTAETTENNINGEAEEVGCHFIDERLQLRMEARTPSMARRAA